MSTLFSALFLFPTALVVALPQAVQAPKPSTAQPEATVIFADEQDSSGKPRKATLTAEQIKSRSADPALTGISGMRIINGALYTIVGGQLIPLPGGGASGCLDPDGEATRTKIAAAKLELIRQMSAIPSPTRAPEKK